MALMRRIHGSQNRLNVYVVVLFALFCAYFLFSNLRANGVHQQDQQLIAKLGADKQELLERISVLEDDLLQRKLEVEEWKRNITNTEQEAPKADDHESKDDEVRSDLEKDRKRGDIQEGAEKKADDIDKEAEKANDIDKEDKKANEKSTDEANEASDGSNEAEDSENEEAKDSQENGTAEVNEAEAKNRTAEVNEAEALNRTVEDNQEGKEDEEEEAGESSPKKRG